MTHNSFFASYTISSYKSQSDSVEICHFCSFISAVFIFLNVGLSQSFCKNSFILIFFVYCTVLYCSYRINVQLCPKKERNFKFQCKQLLVLSVVQVTGVPAGPAWWRTAGPHRTDLSAVAPSPNSESRSGEAARNWSES